MNKNKVVYGAGKLDEVLGIDPEEELEEQEGEGLDSDPVDSQKEYDKSPVDSEDGDGGDSPENDETPIEDGIVNEVDFDFDKEFEGNQKEEELDIEEDKNDGDLSVEKWRERISLEGRARKEAERKALELEQVESELREKVKSLEESYSDLKKGAIRKEEDPEFKSKSEELNRVTGAIQDKISMEVGFEVDFHGIRDKLSEALSNAGNNFQERSKVLTVASLALAGKHELIDSFYEQGIEAVNEELSADEIQSLKAVRSMIYTEMGSIDKISKEMDDISKKIETDSYDYKYTSRRSSFEKKRAEVSQVLKDVLILDSEALENAPHAFASVMSRGLSSDNTKKHREEAVKSIVKLVAGGTPLNKEVMENYDDPSEVQKQIDISAKKESEKAMRDLYVFRANKPEIMKAVEFYSKHKAEEEQREVDSSHVASAMNSPKARLSDSKPESALDKLLDNF